MEFLRFLADIRTPIGNAVFSVITAFGEETLFIVLGIIFFWCINKKEGYYLLSIGFIGTALNQFLKLAFRIPRPWVLDTNFKAVENAIPAATGYSFPSGHTQSAVGIFGGIARWNKQKWLRILCIAISVLVPFSRMYLGVHTPLDVGVSIITALILIFAIYPIVKKSTDSPNYLRILLSLTFAFSLGYLLFVNFYNFPKDIDINNFQSGLENGYKMLGCSLAILVSFELDIKYINFETKATPLAQVLKVAIGLIPILLIKTFLKAPLVTIIGNQYIADGIRYFLLALFAGCIWPLTFKAFSTLFVKN